MTGAWKVQLGLAALSGLVAVAAGAFGAHGASGEARAWLQTGGQYQLLHALAVFAALLVWREGGGLASVAGWLFLAGGALFGGSLYALAVTGVRALGAVTPLGGLLLLAGWATLAWAAVTARD